MPPDEPPPYPNRLREAREDRMMTREALKGMCVRLHDEEPLLYGKVSVSAIRDLELGLVRPRARNAASLAQALGKEAAELFPVGFDDPTRNPGGKTNISPERRRGGRPKKND